MWNNEKLANLLALRVKSDNDVEIEVHRRKDQSHRQIDEGAAQGRADGLVLLFGPWRPLPEGTLPAAEALKIGVVPVGVHKCSFRETGCGRSPLSYSATTCNIIRKIYESYSSNHLKQIEFQVIGLLHAPQNGVVAALLPGLDLPQLYPGILGRRAQHLQKQLLRGEVAAGAGGQIAAPWQEPHGPVVDLLIAGHGPLGGLAALGEGRGIQNDAIGQQAEKERFLENIFTFHL